MEMFNLESWIISDRCYLKDDLIQLSFRYEVNEGLLSLVLFLVQF